MTRYDEAAMRLRLAESQLLAKNVELYFAAETVVNAALRVAGGDPRLAEEFLGSVEPYLAAAMAELRLRQPRAFSHTPANDRAGTGV